MMNVIFFALCSFAGGGLVFVFTWPHWGCGAILVMPVGSTVTVLCGAVLLMVLRRPAPVHRRDTQTQAVEASKAAASS